MKKYCPICFRKVSINKKGRVYRHGFKKNRWVFNGKVSIKKVKYKKVDSSPCEGTGQTGITRKQIEKKKK